jgi:1-phosphofructokinase family hexose kinase
MIITFTPNPALDVTGTVINVIPNEKSYVTNEKRLAGGNGINAARIIHRLGAEVLATGFLGGNTGTEFSELIKQEGIPQHFIMIEGKTRTNVTISLEKSHEQTRLSFPGPEIQKKEIAALTHFMEYSHPDLLLIGGSLPSGATYKFIKSIIKEFNHKGIPVFVDMPGKILKDILSAKPFFIKPNLTEFQEMTGKKLLKISEVLTAARKFSNEIPLQCISSVEGGALLVTKDHAWFGKIPKIKVQSTVGAGDSMVGAISYAFVKGNRKLSEKNCVNMLQLGLAASCATLSNKGLTMGSKKNIKACYPKITIKQID